MTTMTTPGTSPPAPVDVRKAGAGDVEAVVDVLVRAFDEDPVVNWFVREDEQRDAGMRAFFDLAVRALTLPHEEVYLTAGGEGAALWTPPGRWQLGSEAGEELLGVLEGVFGPDKLSQSLQGMEAMQGKHPHAPHFYLMLLGVDPRWHSRGIGSRLMRTVLRRCDEAGLPAYLEATSPRNVPLYQRHGFVVTEELHLPDDGPPLWLMWRSPRQPG